MRISVKFFVFLSLFLIWGGTVFSEDKGATATKTVPAVKKSDANLPANIKLIIGKGGTKNYYVRIRAIHALDKFLRPAEIEALYVFLYDHLEDQKLPNLQFNALKNEIVLKLMDQQSKLKNKVLENLT